MKSYSGLLRKYNEYSKYLESIGKPNICFRLFWLDKATKYTGKGLDYIIYNDQTMIECKKMIYSLATHKPNRIWNQVLQYKKYKESLK